MVPGLAGRAVAAAACLQLLQPGGVLAHMQSVLELPASARCFMRVLPPRVWDVGLRVCFGEERYGGVVCVLDGGWHGACCTLFNNITGSVFGLCCPT